MSKNIYLRFNEETGKWEERAKPFMTIDIDTEEDFKQLNKVLQAYYDNTAHVEKGACSECGYPLVETGSAAYCYHCGRRFVEEDE